MKKILFIIQSYPSEKSANVICDEKIIRELLKEEKYEIHCLTYQYNKQKLEDMINEIHVHRFSKGIFWDIYTWARHNENLKRSKVVLKLQRFFLRIKQILTIPIYPCYEPINTYRYIRAAEKLYCREKFDLVVAEHNGFDTVYTGYTMKSKHPELKFIPIFWDSMSGGFAPKYLPISYVDTKRKRYEKKIFELADRVFIMQSHQKYILQIYKDEDIRKKIKILNIPYLQKIDSSHLPLQEEVKFSKNEYNIVFAGSMGTRNPDFIFNLVKHIKKEGISLWIITDTIYHSMLQEKIGPYKDRIKVISYMAHEKLLRALEEADCFLNIGVNNPNAISGKIFEYMSFGKPVISTYFIDDEACIPYLRRYPLSYLIDERNTDYDTQAQKLSEFIEQTKGCHVPFELLEKEFYLNMPIAYTNIIEELLSGGSS